MKATRIRINNKKPNESQLNNLVSMLNNKFKEAGFITDITIESSSSIKIMTNSRVFTIDTEKLGRNVRYSKLINSITGWKYTNLPTWKERVEFNHIVNDCFDALNMESNIVSGVYKVRSYHFGRANELDWKGDSNQCFITNNSHIEKATDQHYEERKKARRERARELRQQKKESKFKRVELRLV